MDTERSHLVTCSIILSLLIIFFSGWTSSHILQHHWSIIPRCHGRTNRISICINDRVDPCAIRVPTWVWSTLSQYLLSFNENRKFVKRMISKSWSHATVGGSYHWQKHTGHPSSEWLIPNGTGVWGGTDPHIGKNTLQIIETCLECLTWNGLKFP